MSYFWKKTNQCETNKKIWLPDTINQALFLSYSLSCGPAKLISKPHFLETSNGNDNIFFGYEKRHSNKMKIRLDSDIEYLAIHNITLQENGGQDFLQKETREPEVL